MQMMEFLHYHIIPFTVVLTKTDKLSKMKLKEHVRAIAADLCLGVGNLIPVSAETGFGKDAVLEKIGEIVAAEKRKRQPEEDGERDEKKRAAKMHSGPSVKIQLLWQSAILPVRNWEGTLSEMPYGEGSPFQFFRRFVFARKVKKASALYFRRLCPGGGSRKIGIRFFPGFASA